MKLLNSVAKFIFALFYVLLGIFHAFFFSVLDVVFKVVHALSYIFIILLFYYGCMQLFSSKHELAIIQFVLIALITGFLYVTKLLGLGLNIPAERMIIDKHFKKSKEQQSSRVGSTGVFKN